MQEGRRHALDNDDVESQNDVRWRLLRAATSKFVGRGWNELYCQCEAKAFTRVIASYQSGNLRLV